MAPIGAAQGMTGQCTGAAGGELEEAAWAWALEEASEASTDALSGKSQNTATEAAKESSSVHGALSGKSQDTTTDTAAVPESSSVRGTLSGKSQDTETKREGGMCSWARELSLYPYRNSTGNPRSLNVSLSPALCSCLACRGMPPACSPIQNEDRAVLRNSTDKDAKILTFFQRHLSDPGRARWSWSSAPLLQYPFR
jgi:hypothetical protein